MHKHNDQSVFYMNSFLIINIKHSVMKKIMTRIFSLVGILLLGSLKSTAQVNDVSFIVSPSAEYIW